MTASFEGLGHRAFQGHRERCFKDTRARWILDGEDVLRHRSTLDVVFESGKLGSRISSGAHGSSGLVCSYDLNWFGVGARTI